MNLFIIDTEIVIVEKILWVRTKKMVSIEDCKVYVIHCIVQRFGPLEALAYLRSKGIEIQQSTYYKYRKIIKESRYKRMNEIADVGYIDYHLDARDTLEWAKKEMIANYHNEKDPFKKTEILTQIINMLPYFAEYINETKEVMKYKILSNQQSSTSLTKTE